jgi:Endosomal/lysosomal potassium channel TMEM175
LIEKRAALSSRRTVRAEGFRLRGLGVTRVEALSDVVFGFALTLVGVSSSVPRTFDQLLEAIREFPAFAVCFGILILLWHDHYTFFRRYGLEDNRTIVLNSLLLFLVILYVYPLKFLFSMLVILTTTAGAPMVHMPDGKLALMIGLDQAGWLTFIFGSGFAAVYALLALLYAHALGLRGELQLNTLEVFESRERIVRYSLLCGVGVIASLCALSAYSGRWAGWVFASIPVVRMTHFSIVRRHRAKLKALASNPF